MAPGGRGSRCGRVARSGAVVGVTALLAVGCAGAPRVIPVRLSDPAVPASAALVRQDYGPMVRALAGLLEAELGLPLPAEVTVRVYPSRRAYAVGLAETGGLPARRADEIAASSVGLGQRGRLFLEDGALRMVAPAVRLGIVAHELTHVSQYALAGGRRGTSERWLREGMADWVAGWVLERLGIHSLARERWAALGLVAGDLPTPAAGTADLAELGRPLDWDAPHRPPGHYVTDRLAFLLTDELIRRRGFPALAAYFRAFGRADDRFGNFRAAFGVELPVFEREALAHLRAELGLDRPAVPPAYPER